MNHGFVYVLSSSNSKRYYIGSTSSPDRRLEQHNLGKVTATKNKGPWTVVLLQEYESETKAKQIEWRVKKLKSRVILEQMIKDQKITLN